MSIGYSKDVQNMSLYPVNVLRTFSEILYCLRMIRTEVITIFFSSFFPFSIHIFCNLFIVRVIYKKFVFLLYRHEK